MATIDSLDGRIPEVRKTQGSGASLVWLVSCSMIAGAGVLAVAPRVLPATGSAIGALARHGLTWPLLAGLGLVIATIAITARRAHEETEEKVEPQREPTPPLSQDPLARDIAAELARVRGGLHDLRVEFVYVKDGIARLQQTTSQASSSDDNESDAAIFRLAASLDQLGGRIEHELASQRTWLAEVLENQTQRVVGQFEPLPRFADPYVQGLEGPEHEIELDEGFEPHADDLHVEVTLEADPSWGNGLGVLDQIEEPRAPLSRPKPTRVDLEVKMAHLRALLADPAVQQALETQ